MINKMQMALIKKDMQSIMLNKNFIILILLLPLLMTVVLPSVLILAVGLSPQDSESFKQLSTLIPAGISSSEQQEYLIKLLLNNMLPILFLIIPIMTSLVMAASSFVGEKEKRTLETLLYCPLSLREIFSAKIISSFAVSQFVSLSSFVVMSIVIQTEIWLITQSFMPLGLNWLALLLLVSPAISLVAITMIVRGSAKAKSSEEAQQRSAFLILPVIVLGVGQFSGLMMINVWLLLGIGVICAVVGLILLQKASSKFNYDRLLQ